MTNPTEPSPESAEEEDGLPPVSPDFFEQDFAERIDNIIPTRGYQMTPMVGLGGSAGSIQALTEFFKAMPPDSGMVFVVILHLSPTHESTMAELLGRSTTMPVVQAVDGQKVEPNRVYVIPPGKYLATVDGHLKLSELGSDRGKRVAVDLFFRSLADTHGPHAAAVVLSGADGDGALGIKRIKERGGLTIAQDPEQAEYPGMPRASIDTGMIDWVLEVDQIPKRLLEYHKSAGRLKLPPEEGPQPAPPREPTADEGEAALRDVLVFLRTRTGRDFSYYKRATILRRIARRMQVNGVDNLPAYLIFLRTHPGEAGALLQDLLISVTNFFRDREVFEKLAQYVPELFAGKTQSDSVRVWVPACATGEEAYSLAMMLLEHARKLDSPPALQVFACDLDDQAIQTARAGHYPEAITADVSEERLRRFFVKEHNGYRVRRELREMVLFAAHDLLKDAPFSRMDLISCRNLMIYLNRGAQQRVLDTFHFALKPDGRLLLGSSEAVDDDSPLFRVLDKKHRIYLRQPVARTGLPLPSGPSSLFRSIEAQAQAAAAPVVHGKRFVQDAAVAFPRTLGADLDRASLSELHLKLIEQYAPPSVVVNAEHEIVHLSEHAGRFLKFAGGEPTMNLLRVVHPLVRVELRTALFHAAESNGPVEKFDVPAEVDGQSCTIDIRVAPAHEIAPGFLLVVFEKRPGPAEPATADEERPLAGPEPVVRHLERELEQVKSNLRDTVEQYEASTEELKASNEELQAMNEELRSATEELETSREELQSINEELTTVNQEMKRKVDELAHANSDLQNLMASTSIATVFLDRELAITRFTPSAAGMFNMIPGDVGRPLAHLKHRLEYPELIADAEKVLRTLVPIEREVHDDGHWYYARLQPYRTVEDHIAGAVLTLVDVSERNRATEALRLSEDRMRVLIESAKDYAIFTTDKGRRVDSWNTGAQTVFGYSEQEILRQSADVLFTPEDRAKGDPEREAKTARDEGHAGNERWLVRKDGSIFYGLGSLMPLRDKAGALRGFVKIIRDLTESKRTEEALREQMDELTRFNTAAVGRESRMVELKKEINELAARLGEGPRYAMESDRQ
jgi:two-component system CheB/CheR fusion protein